MAAGKARFVFDAGLTLDRRGRIVEGIPRVEAAFAEALMQRRDIDVAFCRFRSRYGAFQYVPAETVREALQAPRSRGRAVDTADASKPHSGLRQFGKSVERAWRRHLFPPSNLVNWGDEGIHYLSVGAWWNHVDEEALRDPSGRRIARRVLMCHDTIPLLFPDYFDDPGAGPRFRRGLNLLSGAGLVLCNSRATRLDLEKALDAAGLPRPATVVTPLPPGISPADTVPVRPAGFEPGRFVLSVGSISRRKNQEMLCTIWDRLASEPELADVRLVLVGAWGDQSAGLRKRLQNDPQLSRRVMVRSDIADGELAWLYRNCLFTLYPSFYEGWGLPIGESLAFGKFCVASNTSAMSEAGQGLCLHLAPDEPGVWHDAIRALLREPEQLKSREQATLRYRAPTWDEVVDQLKTMQT